MSNSKSVLHLNRELTDRLVAEPQADPQSIYAGKRVGIANGQVVIVADNWDDVARNLRQVEPDPQRTFCRRHHEPRNPMNRFVALLVAPLLALVAFTGESHS